MEIGKGGRGGGGLVVGGRAGGREPDFLTSTHLYVWRLVREEGGGGAGSRRAGRWEGARFSHQYSPVCMEIGKGGRGGGGW